jgi:protein-disulfide isomerase
MRVLHVSVLAAVFVAAEAALAMAQSVNVSPLPQLAQAAEQKLPFEPEIDPERPSIGPPIAPVTIVEYGDFQCALTDRARAVVGKILQQNQGKIRFVFKPTPLDKGEMARTVAQYYHSVSAIAPQKSWAYFDLLFDNRERLRDGKVDELRRLTVAFGVSLKALDEELRASSIHHDIAEDLAEARRFGVDGTPTFMINGKPFEGDEAIAAQIDAELGSILK